MARTRRTGRDPPPHVHAGRSGAAQDRVPSEPGEEPPQVGDLHASGERIRRLQGRRAAPLVSMSPFDSAPAAHYSHRYAAPLLSDDRIDQRRRPKHRHVPGPAPAAQHVNKTDSATHHSRPGWSYSADRRSVLNKQRDRLASRCPERASRSARRSSQGAGKCRHRLRQPDRRRVLHVPDGQGPPDGFRGGTRGSPRRRPDGWVIHICWQKQREKFVAARSACR